MKSIWRNTISFAAAILLVLSGCGSSHESQLEHLEKQIDAEIAAQSPSERRQSMRETEEAQRHWEHRQEAKRKRAKAAEEAGGPPADWTSDEKGRFGEAKLICESEPQSQLASEWRVHNDAASIAHAMGREFRLRQDMEIATEEGCLAALVP
jgi:sRNA-binding protein